MRLFTLVANLLVICFCQERDLLNSYTTDKKIVGSYKTFNKNLIPIPSSELFKDSSDFILPVCYR